MFVCGSAFGAAARSALFPGSPFIGAGAWRPEDGPAVEEVGWKFVRVAIGWHEVESPEKRLDWGQADARAQSAAQAGLRVQITLNLAWPVQKAAPYPLDDAARLPSSAQGRSAMRRFVQEAVARYGSMAEAYGVEDDLSAASFPGGPEAYGEELTLVSQCVRSADPDARVVFGAVAFDSMEADGRVFYLADALRSLGEGGAVFDAVELRLVGENALEDYRRVPAAVNHVYGQLADTAHRNASVALIASSPSSAAGGGGEDDQAADLVRRALTAASLGVSHFYWGGGPLPKKKAFHTARLLSRIEERYDLARTRIIPRSPTLFHAQIRRANGGKDLEIVWRDYFASGQSFNSSASVELKKLDIEGPARQGLYALSLVPDSDGTFPLRELTSKYFDLGGAPVAMSQDVECLNGLAAGP